jgi:hypothetical protein
MYGLTHQEALDAQKDLMSKFNPSNPEHVKKLKSLTEQVSGGMKTIITEGEMAGKGLYPLSGQFFGGRGFGFTETERAKRRYNPNSAEFKEMQEARKREASKDALNRMKDSEKREAFSSKHSHQIV